MTSHNNTGRTILTAGVLVLFALAAPLHGQTKQPAYPKVGGFAGVTLVPSFTFDGETFDGETAYKQIDGEELVFLPLPTSSR